MRKYLISAQCRGCGQRVEVPSDSAVRYVRCARCGKIVELPRRPPVRRRGLMPYRRN